MAAKKEEKILEEKNKITNIVKTSSIIIRSCATVVVLIYSWLKFNGLDIKPVVNSMSAELITQFTIIIYYFSWLFGCTLDTNIQGIVLHKVANNGKIPILGIIWAIILAILFIGLCTFFKSKYLPIVFSIFWIMNFIVYFSFVHSILKSFIETNRKYYATNNNLFSIKRFEIVQDFLYSKWNYIRFIIGAIILIPALTLSFINYFTEEQTMFYISLILLLFVIIVEGWIWYYRLKRKFCLDILSEMINSN